MIRHIFTLIWNQRRKYWGIFAEQALVFLVVVICLVSLVGAYKRFNSPGLLNTKNTYNFGHMMRQGYTREDGASMMRQMAVIAENLRKKDYVVAVSNNAFFTPYMRPSDNYWSDSIAISPERKIYAQTRFVDQWADEVYNIKLLEGRWFTDDERPNGHFPAIVTKQFVDEAGMENPIGKVVQYGGTTWQIMGVMEGLKAEPFIEAEPVIIMLLLKEGVTDFFIEYVAKIEPGHEDDLYSDFYANFTRLSDKTKVEPMIDSIDRWRGIWMSETVTELAFLAIPTIFLLIFAFIGAMGLTLMNLKSRIPELAVRMAIGSTHWGLAKFVILQNLLISVLAVIPGCIIAAFVYEWNATTFTAVGFSVGLILFFSILSSWYPVRTLAKLNPATALKNE